MMKKICLSLAILLTINTVARAQWAVIDPANIATSITNMAKNIAQTSTTATNVINNFKETTKIFEQGKKYYDALKAVNNLVKDARKVKETLLLVEEISEIYFESYKKMLSDPHYTIEELNAISTGYAKILQEAANMIMDLKGVTSSTGLSMNDKERMEIIDTVYSSVLRIRNLTNYYTRKNISVSFIRAREQGDMERVTALYGRADRYW